MRSLERGYAGRLATVSEDGYPYCVPLLYIWADNQVFLHGTSARGHLRSNVEREPLGCFEVDQSSGVFDYGRFECDSGLAYQSVILFGRIRIVDLDHHSSVGRLIPAGNAAKAPDFKVGDLVTSKLDPKNGPNKKVDPPKENDLPLAKPEPPPVSIKRMPGSACAC